MRLPLFLALFLLGCSSGSSAARPTEGVHPPESDQRDTVELVGQLQVVQIAEVCGWCGTGLELVARGQKHDLVAGGDLSDAAMRCADTGRDVRVVGRFVEGSGSCDEGRCRYFAAERIETECGPP
jgi:hypothetical protein